VEAPFCNGREDYTRDHLAVSLGESKPVAQKCRKAMTCNQAKVEGTSSLLVDVGGEGEVIPRRLSSRHVPKNGSGKPEPPKRMSD